MKTIERIILVLLVIILNGSTTKAQELYHQVYNINDGLPSNEVHDIYIDSLNTVWITTDRGVCTYDGHDIKTFSTKDGLSYNTNFKIISDNKNRLWFTGYNTSLSYFENGRFHNFMQNKTLQENFKGNWVYDLDIDNDGGIHIVFENFRSNFYNNYIYLDSLGQVSRLKPKDEVMGRSDRFKLDLVLRKFSNKRSYIFPQVSLPVIDFIDDERKIFLVNKNTFSYSDFGIKYNYEKSIVFELKDKELKVKHEFEQALNDIFQDANNNTLISSSEGILFFENGTLDNPPSIYFKDIAFTSITQDKEGNYWASTLNNGLYFIPSFKFKLYSPANLNDVKIISLEYLENYLLIGTSLGNIYSLKSGSNTLEYKLNLKGSIASFNKKANRVNVSGNWFFNSDDTGRLQYASQLSSVRFKIGLERKNGDFVCTNDTDIAVYKQGKLNYSNIPSYNLNNQNSRNEITSRIQQLFEDENNSLWFGTIDGLFEIQEDNYNFIKKVLDKENFLDVRIQEINVDKNANKWIATIGNGLICFTANREVIQFTIKDGLSSEIVQALEFENDTTLWVGTNNGLDRLTLNMNGNHPILQNIQSFDNVDGLPFNFINELKLWENQLWIGTNGGLIKFNPNENQTPQYTPKVIISEALIEKDSVSIENNHTYEYDQNNIYISYRGISYRQPEKNFYSYCLTKKGETDQWISTDQSELRFSNLSPGTYVFKIRAKTKYEVWSDTKELKFKIQKHFVNTFGFMLVMLFLGLFFLYQLYRWRVKVLLERDNTKKTIEAAKLKTEIAELTTFRNQFNPHFIFNILTSIQHSIFNEDVKKANYYLSNFGKLMRKSLNLMKSKYVTLEKELDFLKAYLELEFLRFPDKFEYRFEIEDDLKLENLFVPPLLFQPAIENVLKHAFNDITDGILSISIATGNIERALCIFVKDNGTGMLQDSTQERDSFRLKLIEDRIRLLSINYPEVNSYFRITSLEHSSGTIAEFHIPKISKSWTE